jgi:poly(3-hydroxybutyrate) depolymerase
LTKSAWFLALAPFILPLACTVEDAPTGGTAGSTGSAGNATTAGATGQAGSTGTAGVTGTASASGSAGMVGTGGTPGAAGTTGATGTAGATGVAGATGTAGVGNVASGKSAGCGKVPAADDSQTKFILKVAHVTTTLDPIYLAGGDIYMDEDLPRGGKYDFQTRPYSVRLPKDYDPTKAYAVVLAGGGCGGSAEGFASNPGGGYQPDNTSSTIQVGLSYLGGCFADGGRSFADAMRTDTPEVPYVRQVIADVQANYCVDKSLVFESGTSSGGWESFTTGCGAADLIRAIGPVSGGLRLHRPACTGPQAAIMVEGLSDGANPIGPITPPDGNLDSTGSAPARDEILKRNGCVAPDYVFDYSDTTKKQGSAPHEQWDPAYPSCVKYTGCPAAYPVVWCALNCGHQCDNETIDGTKYDYKAGIWKFFTSLPSR